MQSRPFAVVILTAVALVAAACGPDSGPATDASSGEATSTPADADGAAPAATDAAAGDTGGTAPATTSSVASSLTTSSPPASSSSPSSSAPVPPASSSTSSSAPASTGTTSIDVSPALAGSPADPAQTVRLRFESRVADVATADLAGEALAILNDERGWGRAGFTFEADETSPLLVVLAEGSEVDRLCFPLQTYGSVSCQNGPIVALNADRWRRAVDHWDAAVADYRGYLVNHEVGHLLGQRHPKPRCPVAGRPAGVMEQQTAGLEGCVGNAWPRAWEIELAARRPVVYAPLPDWGPDPVPANGES